MTPEIERQRMEVRRLEVFKNAGHPALHGEFAVYRGAPVECELLDAFENFWSKEITRAQRRLSRLESKRPCGAG